MITLVPRAMQMIEDAIGSMIKKGIRVERIQMIVCPEAPISKINAIETRFGILRVKSDGFVPKGMSYLIEDPGRRGRGFAWVSRNQKTGDEKH